MLGWGFDDPLVVGVRFPFVVPSTVAVVVVVVIVVVGDRSFVR